jgi:propionyl-CoA synthetase
VIINDTWW